MSSTIRRCLATSMAMAGVMAAVIAVSPPENPRHVSAAAGEFVPLTAPQRVLDSRPGATTADGSFAGIGVLPSGSVLELQVAGRVGVPGDAESVALNVTTDAAVEGGFVTVFACGSPVPNASNLNYAIGQTIANAVITRIGSDGKVCLYNFGATNLIADVTGYFQSGAFEPLSQQARLLDTRPGTATFDGEFAGIGVREARSTLELTVAGRAGVPGDAGAVALNVTVDAARAGGFVTVFACGVDVPTASNLNYVTGQTIANAVITRLGANGAVCFYTDGATDLIVDVAGVLPASTLNMLSAPQRLLDTRPGLSTSDGLFAGGGLRPAESTLQLPVAGRAGVPADASAVVLNVTADAAVGDGFITIHGAGTERPNASNLNYRGGQTIANAAIARVGAGGQICLYTFGATHLIVDVAGWLTGPAPPASDSGCEAASSPPTPSTSAPTAPTTTAPVIPPGGTTNFTTEAAVAPSSVSRGGVATTTTWVTSTAAATVLVALEVYDPSGTLVFEQSYDTQSFAAGERRAYAVDWTVPPTEALGAHTVRVGVFSPGWGTVLHWNANAAAFTVTNAGPPPPIGFREEVAFTGLTNPTQINFAADGRVFVAEKSGLIKVFDNLSDATPRCSPTCGRNVHNFWDRGLLGMELHPNFPAQPFVYVLYTHDAAIGGTAPRWGTAGATSDGCPTPPGATEDGCVVSGRLSRLQANGNVMTGSEQVLIEDWCQQYPSHSMGTLEFGADGALYVTGGDGASFNFVDYGQDGNPVNPCGDPPGGPGAMLTPPTAQGGALRSQDLRTSGDPASLNGAVLRVNPATGAGLPDNPLAGSADPNARRIIAHGLRNPFRFAIRPGTNELWIGDVGWDIHEEFNRVVNPTDGVVENFGWPCFEGNIRQPGYDAADLNICEGLYNQAGSMTLPYYSYPHASQVVPGETCPLGSSSLAGIDFYTGGEYPAVVRRRDVLRRLLARLHLGRVPGRQRPSQPGHCRRLRHTRDEPGRPPDLTRRRALLRRFRWRHDPAHPVLRRQPASDCCRGRECDVRAGPADGRIHREWFHRPRCGRHPHVRLGSRRRRRLRRFELREPIPDLPAGQRDGQPARHRQQGFVPYGRRRDQRRQHTARRDDRLTSGVAELEGRRFGLVLRLGDRPGRGRTAGLPSLVVADHAPLPVELPLTCAADLFGCEQWRVRRA